MEGTKQKVAEEMTGSKQHLLLSQVEFSLRQVSTFLLPYLPLANAHNSDFIVCRHWRHHTHPLVATDLLKLSDNDLCILPSGSLFTDDSVGMREDCSHVVDGQSDLVQFQQVAPGEETKSLMVCENSSCGGRPPQWDRSIHARWSHTSLQDFVQEARRNTLPYLNVLTDVSQLKCQLQRNTCDKIHISNFMSPKKSHEVDAMAEMCALLARDRGLSKVVDIGSGRGYLGCQMALMYNLKVLGIDSSQTNTESAGTRAGKLGKQWEGLIRNAHEGKLDKSLRLKAVKGSKERSLADLPKAQNKDEDIPDLSQVFNDENSFGIDLERSQEDSLMDDKKKIEITVSDNFNQNCCVSEKATNSSCSECCPIKTTARSKQHGIDRNEKTKRDMKVQSNELDDIQSTITQEDAGHKTTSKNRKLRQGENTTYVAKTRYVTPDLHLLELFDTHSTWSSSKNKQTGSSNDRDEALLLSGLHTCGNLASSTLQLFCNSGAAKALCNVGCCYHLLDEQFLTSPFSKQEDTTGDSTMQSGFPMSSYLRQHGCQLGRNARMLASQAPDRLANHRKLPDRSIYWRALLQEIMCDITGVQRGDWQARNDWQVGKIASKCHTFTEYVHKALQKLRLTDVEVSDEAIAEYERTHCDREHKMCAFFQLKAVLAPCIEALILLDRLHFLLEQDNVTTTHLVQLFDPVTSPRCYALIALK